MQEKFGDKKAMYELLGKFITVAPNNSSPPKVQNQPNKSVAPNVGGGGNILNIAWDPARTGGSIQLT